MRKQIRVFKALSDPNRVRILKMLQVRPLCVCEITAVLHLATSTVSKHLSILRDAELIYDVKDGKWVTYHLNEQADEEVVQELVPILKNWFSDDPVVQQDTERVRQVDRNRLCGLPPEQ